MNPIKAFVEMSANYVFLNKYYTYRNLLSQNVKSWSNQTDVWLTALQIWKNNFDNLFFESDIQKFVIILPNNNLCLDAFLIRRQ